jgi:hypothetical protein
MSKFELPLKMVREELFWGDVDEDPVQPSPSSSPGFPFQP